MKKREKAITFSPLSIVVLIVIPVLLLMAFWLKNISDGRSKAETLSGFSKKLSTSSSEWNFETSGTVEKITSTSSGWVCQAGGVSATTHYARIKYKLPEKAGILPTTFYMKGTIELPADFYTQQKSSLRLMNTDNYGTTLNGVSVGASNADELRVAVYIYSDHLLRVVGTHENYPSKHFWISASPLPVGKHVLELSGSVSQVAPWYLRIDGNTVASGVAMLSPDTVPANERVITRMIVGIDGASSQDSNSMSLIVNDFEIADHDLTVFPTSTSLPVQTPTPTPTPIPTPTSTPIATKTPTPTPLATPNMTITLTPIADTYVYQKYPTKNYGSSSTVHVDGNPSKITYYKFDLTSLAGKTPISANLQLKTSNRSGSTQHYWLMNDINWSESTMVYDNRPLDKKLLITSSNGKTSILNINVTNGIISEIGKLVTIMVESTGSDGLDVYSRQSSYPPKLVISYR